MARSSLRRGRKMPGVSTRRICAGPRIRMPSTRNRVVCALGRRSTALRRSAGSAGWICRRSARRRWRRIRSAWTTSSSCAEPGQQVGRRQPLGHALAAGDAGAAVDHAALPGRRNGDENTGSCGGPSRADQRYRREAACRGRAAIPAMRFSGPWAARRGRTSPRSRPGARIAGPAPGRHRGRVRRSALPWRRPARWRACARRRATSPGATDNEAGRPSPAAIPASTGCDTRWASRGPSWPSCSSGKRSASHSAISRPSTRSPTNSSLSFEPAPCGGAAAMHAGRPWTAER